MKATRLAIPDVVLIEPKVFGDARGFFFESFNQRAFDEATGHPDHQFVQDNHSRSSQGRAARPALPDQQPQGKLVRVVRGAVFDVAVDIRKSSPTFGQWVGVELSEDNQHQLWVPPGFAHGFRGAQRVGRLPLQNHRLLRAAARALHCLERPVGHRLA
jgi:dTDP-4-dehydrorhamnose 3,5-epimerase